MSRHWSANQFDYAYAPTMLGNWEVPKFSCEKPRIRKGRTMIITNNRGHLLPGIPRSKKSPWGQYIDTFKMPNRITRKIADQLNGTESIKAKKMQCLKPEKPLRQFGSKLDVKSESEVEKEEEESEVKEEEDDGEKVYCPIHGYVKAQ